MGRSKTILNRDAQWNEVSRLGRESMCQAK